MKIECGLCFRACELDEGQIGACGARKCENGKIVCMNYGRVSSLCLDPIEKKPLRRFMPGTMVLSVGGCGCNMRCPFCQNAEISRARPDRFAAREIAPRELVDEALRLKRYGNIGLAYTYNEPIVAFEFVADCADLAHERGMKNVLVTNGMANEKPWRELIARIDAANIDLKSFSADAYRAFGGELRSAMRSIETASEKCHVEVTTLVIPGINDSDDEMRAMSKWLASVGEIPLHVSRFFPRHAMTDRGPTPVRTVRRLADIARENLKYVYTGNC